MLWITLHDDLKGTVSARKFVDRRRVKQLIPNHHHQVLFQATWPTHIIHTKTHHAHKNTRKHIKHTKKDKNIQIKER